MEQGLRQALGLRINMTVRGWKLLEDSEEPWPLDIARLKPVSILRAGEDPVPGNVMRSRASDLNACLGQRHAEWLYYNPNRIPSEWEKFRFLFPATVWLSPIKVQCVPYMFCATRHHWFVGFDALDKAQQGYLLTRE